LSCFADKTLPEVIKSLNDKLGGNGEEITWADGVAYALDPLRDKLLSISTFVQSFGYYGLNQSSRYLKIESVASSGNGLILNRDATIVGLSTKARSDGNYQIEIRKNDIMVPMFVLNANSGLSVNNTLDLDVDLGDMIQLYLNGTEVDHPLAFIEIAWRQSN